MHEKLNIFKEKIDKIFGDNELKIIISCCDKSNEYTMTTSELIASLEHDVMINIDHVHFFYHKCRNNDQVNETCMEIKVLTNDHVKTYTIMAN